MYMVLTLKKGANKSTIEKLFKQIKKRVRSKGIDSKRFCGKLQLKENALKIQKDLRNEW